MIGESFARDFNLAVWNGEDENALEMLRECPELAKIHLPSGDTALCRAAHEGRIKIVRVLLDEFQVDPNEADGNGDSPLWNACMGGRQEIAWMLIDHGAGIDHLSAHMMSKWERRIGIRLVGFDPTKKINVIKVVRELTGVGLKEAKDFVENSPSLIASSHQEAQQIFSRLQDEGALVEFFKGPLLPQSFLPAKLPGTQQSSTQSTNTGGGCYIATACYGSDDHPDVLIFRRFRDQLLLKTSVGKTFVTLYYKLSPPIAARIGHVHWLSSAIRRWVLEPLARILR